MSSEKTGNLGLHKWAPTDSVLRTEFNDNFGKIDEKAAEVDTLLSEAAISNDNTVNIKKFSHLVTNNDWAAAYDAARDYLVTNFDGGFIEFSGKTYDFSRGIVVYTDRIGLKSRGNVTLNFLQTTGSAIRLYASKEYPTRLDYINEASLYLIRGFKIKVSANVTALDFGHETRMAAFYDVYNVNFLPGGGVGVNIWSNTWCVSFHSCRFRTVIGMQMLSGGVNYGENISVRGGVFDGCISGIINANSAGDIRLNMVSLDYCRRMITVQSGSVVYENGFFESSFDVDYWFHMSGYGSFLQIVHSKGTVTANILNKEMFYVDDASGYGEGLTIENTFIANGAWYQKDTLVAGNGRIDARRVFHYRDAVKIPIARQLNVLRYDGFNDPNSLLEWKKFTFAEMSVLDTTTFYEGTQSMKFSTATNGNSCGAYVEFPIKRNEMATLSFRRKIQGFQAAGKQFTATAKYLDANDAVLWSGGILTDTLDTDWKRQFANIQMLPPRGTTKLRIEFYAGAITNTCVAWADDMIVNIC